MNRLKLLVCLFLTVTLISSALIKQGYCYYYIKVDGSDGTRTAQGGLKDEHPSDTASWSAAGEAITANSSYTLGYVSLFLKRVAVPTSDIVCAIYNTTGTVGTDATPDGNPALVYSEIRNALFPDPIPTSYSWINFNFTSSMYNVINQTDYAISVEVNSTDSDTNNYVLTGFTNNAHMGNRFKYTNGAWANISLTYDLSFRIYAIDDPINPVVEYFGFNSTLNGTVSQFTYNFSDNLELSHFVYGWNNSGSWVNTTYSLSGLQNQTIINFTLNATDGMKIEYRVWVNDTFNNWASNSLSFFYTNTEPIISVGEGFLIMGVFFLVGVFGIIGYIAYSKH